MTTDSQPAASEPDSYQVQGDEKLPRDLRRDLAQTFVKFLEDHANDEIRLVGCYDLNDEIEAVRVEFSTGTHQQPVHDIRPVEPLLIIFGIGGAPLVASLRQSFPCLQHTFGIEIGALTNAQLALCIDDRVWEDAAPSYNGAEIVRRIYSWFQRAISGKMNDELQFQDPVFLLSPVSIVVGLDLENQILTQDRSPVFLAISNGDEGSDTFFAYLYDDVPEPAKDKNWPPFLAVSLELQANNTGAMWRPPSHLGQLNQCVSGPESDLLAMLKGQLADLWDRLEGEARERLKIAQLIIHVVINNVVSNRAEPFWLILHKSVADIAVDLGILWAPINGNESVSGIYGVRIQKGEIDKSALAKIPIFSASSFWSFEPESARQLSGLQKVEDHAAIVGVGSIGSQIVTHLVREGAFDRLTLIDDDRLSPHNVARHVLTSASVSHLKSTQMAKLIDSIAPGYPVTNIVAKVGSNPPGNELLEALADASVVLDLTASLGASREISDLQDRGRAISAFFNPLGTAYVVLVEDRERKCDLAVLEANYYAEIVNNEHLAEHLSIPNQIVISSGQCRSVSNRLSSTDAALLSAAASRSIRSALERDVPSIIIGVIAEDGSLRNSKFDVLPSSIKIELDGWDVRMTGNVNARLQDCREAALPNETGGVLLGVVDHKRKRIEVALALPPPSDSEHAPAEFVRGVQDLKKSIDLIAERVMHQMTYVGEWHSHPPGAASIPSSIDQAQLDHLADNLCSENRPSVMAIVGEQETRIFGRGQ